MDEPMGRWESHVRWLLQRAEQRGVKAEPGSGGCTPVKQQGCELHWSESPLPICNPRGLGMSPESPESLKRLLSTPAHLHSTTTNGKALDVCFF